jgi:hypothetical protein
LDSNKQEIVPPWLQKEFKRSVALRQAQQAVMLGDLQAGLKIERDGEMALRKYYEMPDAQAAEDDTIHLGDITVNHAPAEQPRSAPRASAAASAMKYLAILAALASGGWTATSLGYLAVQAFAKKPDSTTIINNPPKSDSINPWRDFDLKAIDD